MVIMVVKTVVMVVKMVAMSMALAQPELLLPPDVVEDWRPAGWANVIASPLPWTPPDLYCLWNTSLLCLANIFDEYPYLKNTSIQVHITTTLGPSHRCVKNLLHRG